MSSTYKWMRIIAKNETAWKFPITIDNIEASAAQINNLLILANACPRYFPKSNRQRRESLSLAHDSLRARMDPNAIQDVINFSNFRKSYQ